MADLFGCKNYCPVCKQLFQDPRILPCGHTLCARCIWMCTNTITMCPICFSSAKLATGGLLPNFHLEAPVNEGLSEQGTTKHSCKECNCLQSMSDMWTCDDCQQTVICSVCALERHREHNLKLMLDGQKTETISYQQSPKEIPKKHDFINKEVPIEQISTSPLSPILMPPPTLGCEERPLSWPKTPRISRDLIKPSETNIGVLLSEIEWRPVPLYVYPVGWKGKRDIRYLKEFGWKIPLPMFCTPAGFEWRIEPPISGSILAEFYYYYVTSIKRTMKRIRGSIYRFDYPFWMAVYCEMIYGLCDVVDNNAFFRQFSESQLSGFVLSMVITITQCLAFPAYSKTCYKKQRFPNEIWFHKWLDEQVFDEVAKIAPPLVRSVHQHILYRGIAFDDQAIHQLLHADGYTKAPFNEYLINWEHAGKIWPWKRLEKGPIYVLAPKRMCTTDAIHASRSVPMPIFEKPYDGILPPESTKEFESSHRPYPRVHLSPVLESPNVEDTSVAGVQASGVNRQEMPLATLVSR